MNPAPEITAAHFAAVKERNFLAGMLCQEAPNQNAGYRVLRIPRGDEVRFRMHWARRLCRLNISIDVRYNADEEVYLVHLSGPGNILDLLDFERPPGEETAGEMARRLLEESGFRDWCRAGCFDNEEFARGVLDGLQTGFVLATGRMMEPGLAATAMRRLYRTYDEHDQASIVHAGQVARENPEPFAPAELLRELNQEPRPVPDTDPTGGMLTGPAPIGGLHH